MTILKNLACVWPNDMSVRACLIRMIQKGVKPSFVFITRRQGFKETLKTLSPEALIFLYRKWKYPIKNEDIQYSYFLFGENIMRGDLSKMLSAHNIPFEILSFRNFNERKVIEKLSSLKQNYILTAPPTILKKPFFQIGKYLINVHKGILPHFRGSSASHYAVLNEGKYGATVHFMDEGIDTGSIIAKKEYEIPKVKTKRQISIYEYHMSSDLLSDVMVKFSQENELLGYPQDINEGEQYFGMHPVLNDVSSSRQAVRIEENFLDSRYQWLSEVGEKIQKYVFSPRDHTPPLQKYEFLFEHLQKSGEENFRDALNFIYKRVFSPEESVRASQRSLILELLERKPKEGFLASSFSGELSKFLLSLFVNTTPTPVELARGRPITSSFNQLDVVFSEAIDDETNFENLILAWFLYFTGGTGGLTSNNPWKDSLRTVQRRIALQWGKRPATTEFKLTPLFLGMASICFLYQYNLSQDVLWVDAAIKADDMAIQLIKSHQTEPLDLMIFFASLRKELEVTRNLYEEGQDGPT